MPAPRVIDTTRNKPEPSGVEEFFSKLNTHFREQKDKDILGDLTRQYQANRENAHAWEDYQLAIDQSNMSPSKRLETQKLHNERKKIIVDEDKALNAQAKLIQEQSKKQVEEQEKKANEEIAVKSLQQSGASQRQIDLYKASSEGGKTKIIENVLEEQNRNMTPAGLTSPDIEDYDKGLTPKERVKRQDDRYRIQTPLVMKNSESLSALEAENLSIGLLQELDDTGKVGEGLHNLNINPKTGDLFIPKGGTPEEQLFVKTVNDFTVKAKDSFGARVTNFELDRFMQRLPTLANSKEGRRLIMRQMQIVNQINQLEKKEIQKVFDQYGVRNIDYPDAENKARLAIKDQKESLRKEYLDLEQVAKKEESENYKKLKENVQEGYTAMIKPDGSIKQFPTKNVPNLEEKGYKKL